MHRSKSTVEKNKQRSTYKLKKRPLYQVMSISKCAQGQHKLQITLTKDPSTWYYFHQLSLVVDIL